MATFWSAFKPKKTSLRLKNGDTLPYFFVTHLLILAVCCSSTSTGPFQTRCLERHFLLSIKSSILGAKTRFDVEDQYGLHFLSAQEASLCGYTIFTNEAGDLVFRASFLACHVQSKTDAGYWLRLWFVNLQADGKVAAYPFQLYCSLQGRWSPREIVCEENYMEVSVQHSILPLPSKDEKQQGALDADLAVIFHRANQPPEEARVLSLKEATALGYHVSLRGSRVTLRSSYSSPLSYFLQERGAHLEIVKATILHRLQSNLQMVDVTVACPLNEATVDGSNLLWTLPYNLSVLVYGQFRDRGVRIEVNSKDLRESDFQGRGFKLGLTDGRLEIEIPLGTHGRHIKSGISKGRYSRSMSVDLYVLSQWEDKRWPLSRHSSFRLLKTPLIPQIPFFTQKTVSSEGLFAVTFGAFAADVSLQRVTVDGGGDFLTWTHSNITQNNTDITVAKLSHPNGSHSYQLYFWLSHPKIIPEHIGGGVKRYSFSFMFTLIILPSGDVFYHQATVEQSVDHKAPASPKLEGKCTESSLLVLLHHGAQPELQWELYLGARKLDWDLVEMGGCVVEAEEDYLTVEIPLNSPLMKFLELTLQGLIAEVEISVVDAESLKSEDHLIHRCTFPVREMLLCLPEGRMVAIVDTTHTIPPIHPNQTTLLDSTCVPKETESSRALFSFILDSCGTTVTTEENFLVYENQISYSQAALPSEDPFIHRDSSYRLTVQCRYPVNESRTVAYRQLFNSSLVSSPTPVNRTRNEA